MGVCARVADYTAAFFIILVWSTFKLGSPGIYSQFLLQLCRPTINIL